MWRGQEAPGILSLLQGSTSWLHIPCADPAHSVPGAADRRVRLSHRPCSDCCQLYQERQADLSSTDAALQIDVLPRLAVVPISRG